jgi:hypothetical protein
MAIDWDFVDNNKYYIIGVFVAVAIASIFIMYFFGDPAGLDENYNFKITTIPATTIDAWSVSHLILYFIIGLVAPNYYMTALLVGMGWEKIEAELSEGGALSLVKCDRAKKFGEEDPDLCKKGRDTYWYYKWDDVLINLIGYICGSTYRNEFAPVKKVN